MIKESQDALLIYGDTNSTLAAALAAVKLRVPVIHVEAGNRLGTLDNPEEINRIVADHTATLLFACVPSAMEALRKENLAGRAYLVGDPMLDAFMHYRRGAGGRLPKACPASTEAQWPVPNALLLPHCHREENTRDDGNASPKSFRPWKAWNAPTLYPVHPRNRAAAERLRDRLSLQKRPAAFAAGLSGIGGAGLHAVRRGDRFGRVQREAFFARVPCVTVFPYAVWPETMPGGCNVLAAPIRRISCVS